MYTKRERGFFIKNILVIGNHNNGHNGEYYNKINKKLEKHPVIINKGISDNTRADRIIAQIALLGKYGLENHKQHRLTCIVTDEFSFYTKNTPLTINEYKKIIDGTSNALTTLPPNIVLVISSMPV